MLYDEACKQKPNIMKAKNKIDKCNTEFSDLKRSLQLKCYKGSNFSKCQNINKNTGNCANCIAF